MTATTRTPPTNGSQIAEQLRLIPAAVRRSVGLPDAVPDILDTAAAVMHDLLDVDDGRDWDARMAAIGERIEAAVDEEALTGWVTRLSEIGEDELRSRAERVLGRLKNGSVVRFLLKLVGAKRYAALQRAIEADWALCLLALRRATRAVLPFVQAVDDAALPLTEDERAMFNEAMRSQFTMVTTFLRFDEVIENYLTRHDLNLTGLGYPVRPDEATTLTVSVVELIAGLRVALDLEAERQTADLSEMLLRKFRGFEHALTASDDGVAQAATSLVEYIDRLLRTAGTHAEVLAWVAAHRPDDASLTYTRTDTGKVAPTKRGEAMFFAHAGQAPEPNTTLNDMLAVTLVRVREKTQKIKHADLGTAEEAEQLRLLMSAMRGAVIFLLRATWSLSQDRYADLQSRFERAA